MGHLALGLFNASSRADRRLRFAMGLVAALALTFNSLAGSKGATVDRLPTSVFDKSVPDGAADLRAIEIAARSVAETAIRCTVGLELGSTQGSGVIVSEGGYVLTAAHVIGRPGRDVRVKLPDGTVVRGKTLGIHRWVDVGLVKITGDGPWPYAPIVPHGDDPKVGDWCLATVHLPHLNTFWKKRRNRLPAPTLTLVYEEAARRARAAHTIAKFAICVRSSPFSGISR